MPPKSEPEPEPGPFDPENPADPIGVGGPIHLDPVDPNEPNTLRPGIPYPPDPPAPKDPPPPPPGHADLAAARQEFQMFEKGGTVGDEVQKATGIACASRDSLADLWTLASTGTVRNATHLVKDDLDPDGEQAKDKLTALQSALKECQLHDALDKWCTLRSSAKPDLKSLASFLDTINNEVKQLIKALDPDVQDPDDPSGPKKPRSEVKLPQQRDVNLQQMLLTYTARGIARTIGSEADILLKGGQVPAAAPGEAICRGLEFGTADGNWRQQLEDTKSWVNLGKKIEKGLRDQVGTAGNLDNAGRSAAMSALDQALEARNNQPAGSTPQQLGKALVQAYTRAVNAIHNDIAQVTARLTQLDKGKAPKGWTKEQCQQALDVLVGSMRVIQDQLGADALATDPDTAAAVRTLVVFCTKGVDPTTQESLVAEAKENFGKFWRDGRDAELKALTKLASQKPLLKGRVQSLKAKFDKDFGPSLTAWSAELAKYPEQDRDKMHDLAVKIATTVGAYRDAVRNTIGKDAGAGLIATIDAIASGVVANIRSYQERGGLWLTGKRT